MFSLWTALIVGARASQTPLDIEYMEAWRLNMSNKWDVLGPFPISAREQHFLSPSYPIDLSLPYQHEPNRTWFSSLADGGEVGWSSLNATENGRLLVSHPHIRWRSLRATEGWAAFQHHNVLRTTLEITPPTEGPKSRVPWLALSLQHVSFFALIPTQPTFTDASATPEWHPGNIYGLPRTPKQLIEPSGLSLTKPTSYNLFVSGDYEIRLFGDPDSTSHKGPELDVSVSVTLEPRRDIVALDPALHVICDFVLGWAFGTALGVGIRAVDGQWEVMKVDLGQDAASHFSLSLLQRQRLVASQTRVVPIIIKQLKPFHKPTLQLCITLFDSLSSLQATLMPTLYIRHWSGWDDVAEYKAIKATYSLADTPANYLAIPPSLPNHGLSKPPILALHGAGVDISDTFWAASLPRQLQSWIVCPTGRTSWGFDWHGPSADDAWSSLAALTHLLSTQEQWADRTISNINRTVIIGHSNGGQGTWYLTARYPDRVLAAIPAAAYIKSQQYVPLSLSRGAHFIDPAFTAILTASLTPDDNDLFLSNVVDTSILAIHGGEDENVPTWHSRELVGLVKTLRNDANISLTEEPGEPHWYPDVLSSSTVRTFLSSALENTSRPPIPANQFTLTVANPSESGTFHGFSIRELEIPGRLAKLHVCRNGTSVTIMTSNVRTFSVDSSTQLGQCTIDGTTLHLPSSSWIQRTEDTWQVIPQRPPIRPTGPISQILRSSSRLFAIIPSLDQHAHSIARRLAHSMLLYFRIDVEILTDKEALDTKDLDLRTGDLIIIGSNNKFGDHILRSGPGVVKVSPREFTVHGRTFTESSLAIVFLHPHPLSPDRLVLFLCANDKGGLERGTRLLLPIRTGVPLPEFLIIGREVDNWGIGGLKGGGFWSRTWTWNEPMAWLD